MRAKPLLMTMLAGALALPLIATESAWAQESATSATPGAQDTGRRDRDRVRPTDRASDERGAARAYLAHEARFRKRWAELERLQQIYREQGDREKLEKIAALKEKLRTVQEKHRAKAEERLGADKLRAIDQKVKQRNRDRDRARKERDRDRADRDRADRDRDDKAREERAREQRDREERARENRDGRDRDRGNRNRDRGDRNNNGRGDR